MQRLQMPCILLFIYLFILDKRRAWKIIWFSYAFSQLKIGKVWQAFVFSSPDSKESPFTALAGPCFESYNMICFQI